MLFAAFTSAMVVRRGLSDDWVSMPKPPILLVNKHVGPPDPRLEPYRAGYRQLQVARLTDEQAALFLADNYAVVATLRADGSPHQTATWVDWDGERVLFNITVTRKKYEELQRDPHVSVFVFDGDNRYRWVTVSGTAELSLDGAAEHIHKLSPEDRAPRLRPEAGRAARDRASNAGARHRVRFRLVILCDVGPRDGLQNEPDVLAPSVRAELVNRLAGAGLTRIEARASSATTACRRWPARRKWWLRSSRERASSTPASSSTSRATNGLTATALDRVNVTLAATESFSQRNANASVDEAAARVERILAAADRQATVTISVAFGCPFEGPVDPGAVLALAERFRRRGRGRPRRHDRGRDPTAGSSAHGSGRRARGHGRRPLSQHPEHRLRERRRSARSRRDRARRVGRRARRLPVRSACDGNIATEDLVYLLEGDGIETGVDLDALVHVASGWKSCSAAQLPGQVYGRADPAPAAALSTRTRSPSIRSGSASRSRPSSVCTIPSARVCGCSAASRIVCTGAIGTLEPLEPDRRRLALEAFLHERCELLAVRDARRVRLEAIVGGELESPRELGEQPVIRRREHHLSVERFEHLIRRDVRER